MKPPTFCRMHVVIEILDADDIDDPCVKQCHLVKTATNIDVERAVPMRVISLVESLVLLLKNKISDVKVELCNTR